MTSKIFYLFIFLISIETRAAIPGDFLSQDFMVIEKYRNLPENVTDFLNPKFKETFLNLDISGIAEADEAYNGTDVYKYDMPSRKYVIGGQSREIVFLIYRHGGRGNHYHLVIFDVIEGVPNLSFTSRFSGIPYRDGNDNTPHTIDEFKKYLRSIELENEIGISDKDGYW